MSTCTVKQSVIDDRGAITCDYSEIIREEDDDSSIKYASKFRTSDAYVLKESDFAFVSCWDSSWNK